jgi:hypothetical protein
MKYSKKNCKVNILKNLKIDNSSNFVHLLYPYNKNSNWLENTINFSKLTNESKLKTFNYSNFKVFSIEIPSDVLYFSINVEANDCFKLESFISESREIKYSIEKDYGYTISLNLDNVYHDMSLTEINKGLDEYNPGAVYDFTNRILNFRLKNNFLSEPVKINFFCGYWKQSTITNTFKGSIELLWEDNSDSNGSKPSFEIDHKHMLTQSNDMMLYQLRMYANDYPEISTRSEYIKKNEETYTQNVNIF